MLRQRQSPRRKDQRNKETRGDKKSTVAYFRRRFLPEEVDVRALSAKTKQHWTHLLVKLSRSSLLVERSVKEQGPALAPSSTDDTGVCMVLTAWPRSAHCAPIGATWRTLAAGSILRGVARRDEAPYCGQNDSE